jgi:hypothetical protein
MVERGELDRKTRLLAATATRLKEEAKSLQTAATEAQYQTITAYLIRGYQYAAQGEDHSAYTEFAEAAKVSPTDIYARDIAAGWARRINRQVEERELLQEIQRIANEKREGVHHARALRREAELIRKRNNDPAYIQALAKLRIAQNILGPLVAEPEAKRELGRIHTLFCELRCDRGRPGALDGPNQPLTRMLEYMKSEAMHTRPEEAGGEEYGEDRSEKIKERVKAMIDDKPDGRSND